MPAYGPHLVAAYSRLVAHLATKDDVLLLTTSNRYEKHASWDVPKTTQLARRIEVQLKGKRRRVTLLDVAGLRIHTCEGNISGARGNNCGVRDAKLPDKRKNPTGHHRCWASINNADDEDGPLRTQLERSAGPRDPEEELRLVPVEDPRRAQLLLAVHRPRRGRIARLLP